MVVGNLNMKIADTEGNHQDEAIAAALADEGLEDMSYQFLLYIIPWEQGDRTWNILCQVREVQSYTDYILDTDHRLFRDVFIWDTSHNTAHSMVLG